ncbi:TetR/AcrR family transcriptional regulator [Flexivirga caeni]|uniref:TetR/AcrR family transcriptional regulator n=1 Tax=Flexivirga caeni TaxID=2294115 RepID=A0A3M9MI73_9MICO|nr:TetR/AcrR family transcriptional regulator [Flexivirga caeni]RNI25231.1 TetR/AcrR family transcriptional regulator [Flexivirga caeni]
MNALRNKTAIEDDRLLTAARDCLLAVGWRRTTMTDVARRAGVSRMSVYRRWPDMSALIGDLMTREWSTLGTRLAQDHIGLDAAGIAHAVGAVAAEIRRGELFGKIVDVDPELLIPYLLVRRGRTQDAMLESIVAAIRAGQDAGTVRTGNAVLLARSVLLLAIGFVFSTPTMVDESIDDSALFSELVTAVERYLS